MADYWTDFCFDVPATPEQGAWLCRLHSAACRLLEVSEDDDSDGLRDPVRLSDMDVDVASAGAELAAQFADDSPGVTLRYAAEVGGVRVRSEGGLGNFAYAAALAQLFLRHFGLDEVIPFEWSLTCSVPCSDGYGGGAAVISRDHIELFDTRRFVTEAVAARRNVDAARCDGVPKPEEPSSD